MKKLFTLFLAVLLTASVFAQAPEKMSYQAVIRDAGNNLVTDQAVGMQISILQGTASGTAVYVETQTPTTNDNGLVSIEIGAGTVVSGDFTTIDWTSGPYFIKTETDPDGGISYTITGTSQLLSVPYALHSGTSDVLTGEITESQISDLQAYLVSENDPLFTSWDKSTGIEITESQVIDLQTYYLASNPDGFISDYTVTEEDVTAHQGALGITESQITDLNHFTTADETDPRVPSGTQTGEMQYWDGSEWITVSAGNEGQVLTFTSGVPAWVSIAAYQLSSTEVYNPTTGEIWMDRNLGASQVAISSTDAASYGDLYQWGRASDGHQTIVWTSSTTSDGAEQANETATLSTTDTPGHGNFITNGSSPYDWRSPQNDNLWQGVSGTNNPCPSGYRLPTEAEWEAERTSWSSNNSAGGYASPLKLPVAGIRHNIDGSLLDVGSLGRYWSSTVVGTYSRTLFLYSSTADMYSTHRAYGFSVRCLKD